MISQFNVDYTPNGIALNRGGKPSAVRLTMTMTEAAIHTKADYVTKKIAVDTQGASETDDGDANATNDNVDATGGPTP
jgi:hypothetical protein